MSRDQPSGVPPAPTVIREFIRASDRNRVFILVAFCVCDHQAEDHNGICQWCNGAVATSAERTRALAAAEAREAAIQADDGDEAARERVREAAIGATLPANYMERFK